MDIAQIRWIVGSAESAFPPEVLMLTLLREAFPLFLLIPCVAIYSLLGATWVPKVATLSKGAENLP